VKTWWSSPASRTQADTPPSDLHPELALDAFIGTESTPPAAEYYGRAGRIVVVPAALVESQ